MNGLALTLLTCVVGACIQAACGFGFGPVSMSVLPYLLPYQQASSVTNLCTCTVSLIILVANYRHVDIKMFMSCSLVAIITAPFAINLSVGAAKGMMMRGLGIALILMALYQMYFSGKIRIKACARNGIIAGFISGMLTGLFSMGSPPAAVYMISAAKDKDAYRATINAQFTFVAIIAVATRYAKGLIGTETFSSFAMCIPALAVGYLIGARIFKRLSAKQIYFAVNVYLILSGIMMFFK